MHKNDQKWYRNVFIQKGLGKQCMLKSDRPSVWFGSTLFVILLSASFGRIILCLEPPYSNFRVIANF